MYRTSDSGTRFLFLFLFLSLFYDVAVLRIGDKIDITDDGVFKSVLCGCDPGWDEDSVVDWKPDCTPRRFHASTQWRV